MTGYFSPDAAQKPADPSVRGRALARVVRFGPTMVSLSALIWAAPALAQTTPSTTTVSNNSGTPLATSTSGDITVNAGASIKPPSGAAITLNSNNEVGNNGLLEFQNLNNVTGILALGGNTGSIDNAGTIEVDDTSTTTTDKNGVIHGPFANGQFRVGILVTPGTGDFVSDISNDSTGNITVKGDYSAGIYIQSNLDGSLTNAGAISISGTSSYGIKTLGTVTQGVTLSGTLVGSGQGVQGVNLGGDVTGEVLINGTISTTGYRYTTRSTDPNFLANLTADDLYQSGATITIGGNVTGGVLVDESTSTSSTGVVSVSSGVVTSTGAAPALVIGAAGRNITLGDVGTGTDAYGLEIKGSVTGSGVYDGVTSTALQIGGMVQNGSNPAALSGTVNASDGVHISGTISASAYAASATAMNMNGLIAPVIRNEGGIASVMSSDAAGASSIAMLLGPMSNVPTFQNASVITASVTGQLANAAVIVDQSGTLAEIENIGEIATTRALTDGSVVVSGANTAMDLHYNTTGVHILQFAPAGDTIVPSITGDILLGNGPNNVDIEAGTVVGNINLGSGASMLTVNNGASVKGNLDAVGGTVTLNVTNGILQINDASQLSLATLSVGAASQLIVTADPVLGTATSLSVVGPATLTPGATIGLRLSSILPGSGTYTLIQSDQLSVGTSASLLGSTPYLYNASLQTDAAAGTISATLTRKTAAQLGLPSTSAGAYEPLIGIIGQDAGLTGALLSQTTQTGLVTLYNQLLPNHSGSLFNTLAASVAAFGKPLDDRQDPVGGGFWMQETNAGVFAADHDEDPGYKAWSFGIVAGYEVPRTPLGILGVTFGASTNSVYPDQVDSAEDLHANLVDAGVYWRITKGGFSANARIAADYARISSDRVIEVLGADDLAVSRSATGAWSAYGFNARAAASYEARFGSAYLRPLMSVDYTRLIEGAYTETGPVGETTDLLSVSSRTSSRLTTFAGFAVGALYGPDHSWGPEALIGYKDVASETLGTTTARFVAGGNPFLLSSDDIPGSGAAVHLSLKGENGSGGFSLETGAETRDGLNIYDLRLTGHVQF